jgi:drug/metabolite transporter (DMT)-like permease
MFALAVFAGGSLLGLLAGFLVRRWWILGAVVALAAAMVLVAAPTAENPWVVAVFWLLVAAVVSAFGALGVILGRARSATPTGSPRKGGRGLSTGD